MSTVESISEQQGKNEAVPGWDATQYRALVLRFWVCLTLSVLLDLLSNYGNSLSPWLEEESAVWLQFLIGTMAVVGVGWPFFASSWSSFRSGRPNILVVLAIFAAGFYVYNCVRFFTVPLQEIYFFYLPTTLVTLSFLAQIGVARIRRKAEAAIRELTALLPSTAHVVRGNADIDVALSDLRPGDVLRVLPCERIPADGKITEGSGLVDESRFTGAPQAGVKRKDSPVLAGSLNQTGSFLMIAEKVGEETLLVSYCNSLR